MYNLGLPSGKSLFQLQAERIIRVQDLACMRAGKELSRPASLIHWYVLTSDATHDDTVEYFARMGNFGLDARCVHLFRQGMLPALDSQGRVLLDSRSRVALSPNGNAGVYQALVHSGALAQMESSGVEVVFQYGVDNVLVSVCDPIFVGFVADSKADCAAKVVPKAHPDEPVGVLCMRGGKPAVAEYSEISKEARHLRDASGNLVYSASHICVNAFSLPFLKRHALSPLPFHVAFKKVPYAAGPKGELVNPPAPNAYKAEMFIFDMFQYAERMSALLVPREIEFSPLKNPSGSPSDCPETCRASLYSLHTSWLRSAGAIVDSSACEQPSSSVTDSLTIHSKQPTSVRSRLLLHSPARASSRSVGGTSCCLFTWLRYD